MDKNYDMAYEKTHVECHSGYKINEYPIAFVLEGRRWEVSEILDRWYEGGENPERPVIDYFKVKTHEGRIFILMYIVYLDEWFIRLSYK